MKSFFGKLWSSVKAATSRVWKYARGHKIIAGIVVIIVVGGGYWAYTAIASGNGGTEYVLSTVTRGPLQVTVTGSGQVAANDQLDLSPQASGQVTEVDVTTGESVKAGQVVARIDSTTADEALQSAQSDLESAQISYQEAVTSSQTSVTGDQTSVTNDLSSTYSNIPPVISGLDGILHNLSTITGYTAEENVDAYANYVNSVQAQSYRDEVQQDYSTAQSAVESAQSLYNADTGTTLTTAQIEQLTQTTLTALTAVSTAVNDTLSYYNYIDSQVVSAHVTAPNQLSTQLSSLNSYASTVNGDITSLTNAENSLENDTQTLAQSSSNTPLSIQTAQLNLQKAQEALAQAEQNESDYVVIAPFDGVIANVAVKPYDQASSGTTVATLITTEEYADLSLNEADVAKVQVGQPAALTFDALPNVTMDGTVASVSQVGTVTQGVVTYDVKIGFNQVNSSIKPGMTVDATIITNSVANALQVPSAAIHTVGNNSYVEVATLTNASSTLGAASSTAGTHRFRNASSTGAYGGAAGYGGASGGGFGSASSTAAGSFGANFGSSTSSTSISLTTSPIARSLTVPASEATIKNVPVTIGLSNDTTTEITSGLTQGEYVVTATQTASNSTTKTSAASATSLLGGTRTAGAAFGGGSTFRAGGGGGGGGGAGGGGG